MQAPAKINLHLRVGRAESGFHPVVSWMSTVGLFDMLSIEAAQSGSVSLECDDPSLPRDAGNLAVRAAHAMLQQAVIEPRPGVHIRLEKRIPVGGGLGGGSSDAARVLLGLNRMWQLDLPIARLAQLGATLGSDVPFFLYGASGACTGRGEVVRPIARPKPRAAVLVLPGIVMPTADVYRRFDEMRTGERAPIGAEPDFSRWAELSAGPLLARLANDLEPAAFALCPRLAESRQAVELSLGRPVRMSGSGSSLFTLFDEFDEAQAAAARISTSHHVHALAVVLAPAIGDDLKVT
jgi:4-diphosphocytidyl-2-C-methyl-D-erythritol kinase